MRLFSRHYLETRRRQLLGLVGLTAALYLGEAIGISYVAGFSSVLHRLEDPVWWWLPISFGSVWVSFVGYYFGYCCVSAVEGGPDELRTRERLAAVIANFAGILAHGGSGLDDVVMRAAGASKREAKVRVGLIGFLEQGVLAVPCTIAAIVLILDGAAKPPFSFTLPWAIGPPAGFAIGFLLAWRYRDRLRGRDGWRSHASVVLDTVHLVWTMFRHPIRHARGLGGMLLFWLTDMFALWAALAAFRFEMSWAALVVAFGTAMLLTRRTSPLGGAGFLTLAMAPTLWVSGAPFSAAVLGTFAWRFLTVWTPMPFSFLALPTLRRLSRRSARRRLPSRLRVARPTQAP